MIGCDHVAMVANMAIIEPQSVLVLDYTNHAGKRAMRRVLPLNIWFGVSEYHPGEIEPQWYLRALDVDRPQPASASDAMAMVVDRQPPGDVELTFPERDFLFTSIHESFTLDRWEKRAANDERWRLQQQAWRNAQRFNG